jgi:hypothetical protein
MGSAVTRYGECRTLDQCVGAEDLSQIVQEGQIMIARRCEIAVRRVVGREARDDNRVRVSGGLEIRRLGASSRVRAARQRLLAGFYDRPDVLDKTVEQVLKDLMRFAER